MKGPLWLTPAIGGLMVGMIAMPLPQVLGIGYGVTDDALAGTLPLVALAAICVGKIVATGISLGFGFGGGVFSPSLVVGATLGGAYGVIATQIAPSMSSGPGAYAVIGMGAVAAAVLGAPISTMLIVFEMTADYSVTMAVMVAVVISAAIFRPLRGPSFFVRQLEARGLDLQSGFQASLLRGIRVEDAMSMVSEVIGPETSLNEIRFRLQHSPIGELFVVDPEDRRLIGTITLADLSDTAYDHAFDDRINASDVVRSDPLVLASTDHLEAAFRLFRQSGESQAAVIAGRDDPRLVGCLFERDAMNAYNRVLLQSRTEER
jgi:CIC family chloride channel protein